MRSVEEKFITDFGNGNGYAKYGSATTRYYRPGKIFTGGMITGDTIKYSFRNAGTGIASSGDLGYAYGYVNAGGVEGNYLRVWKKEMSGWKLVLDVENY
jgi:hypothetical protein